MTATSTPADLHSGPAAPDSGVAVSGYVPLEPAGQRFACSLTWSFCQGDTGHDPDREEYLGSPLAPEYHDEARDALAGSLRRDLHPGRAGAGGRPPSPRASSRSRSSPSSHARPWSPGVLA